MNFAEFFEAATDREPYPYQCRLACGERKDKEPQPDWLSHGGLCDSRLINIPTGLGKTAAVVLAWLWNRAAMPSLNSQRSTSSPPWPRRLVYCLPMRTLVEQTQREIRKWLLRLARQHTKPRDGSDLRWLALHSPVILMGGEEVDRQWDIYPEKPAVLVGTQDMLLSRALNRGYGMSRYRWPMHFALLNNDCLWVMDETQLMGVGVETSAQLNGFRHHQKTPMQTFGVCPTWWMSATLEETRLATVDNPKPVADWPVEKLSDGEQTNGRPHELITAAKRLSPASLTLSATSKSGYAEQLAELIAERHRALLEKPHPPGTLTLVVVNRVSRAREIYQALTAGKNPLYEPAKVALIHSRFRPIDRKQHTELLFRAGDRIVIATQAVEAGVDVSARLLITELAPWSSLVQRMGRCNRRAEIPDAEVLWINIEPDAKGELLLPYSENELAKARDALLTISNGDRDVSPHALAIIKIDPEPIIRPVIRRRDLEDLFDTTPDLCGQDLDISRYIRDGDDNDVQFFWRDIKGNTPGKNEPPPLRNELCRVSIGDAGKFLGKKPRAWRWNPLQEQWKAETRARPGGVYLVDVQEGGYDDALGWTGDPKDKLTLHPLKDGLSETYAGNRLSFLRMWQTITEHTVLVVKEADILAALLAKDFEPTLHVAALWHDVGKAHEDFQTMLRNGDATREGTLWAKSANKDGKCSRHGFRHELASALAWLLVGPQDATERDLAAYLIAAHHGRVRLSIRSLPAEEGDPQNADGLFARGIWDGDRLRRVPLGETAAPAVNLDLSFMRMGEGPHGPSWLARTIALRDRLGPFRLAYLETLLRAADARASRERPTSSYSPSFCAPGQTRPPNPASHHGTGDTLASAKKTANPSDGG
jgi:CRISPR-associated endonuclease/helicase Cas3